MGNDKKKKKKPSQSCGGSQEVHKKIKWRSQKFEIVFVEPRNAQRLSYLFIFLNKRKLIWDFSWSILKLMSIIIQNYKICLPWQNYVKDWMRQKNQRHTILLIDMIDSSYFDSHSVYNDFRTNLFSYESCLYWNSLIVCTEREIVESFCL
jgi:hypothetical protein